MAEQYSKVAIGDIGTQLFWFNSKSKVESSGGTTTETASFEYALPITAGAEFGGDTESFEAPETDLDYIPKVGGRKSFNDISYTVNFTADKYARAEEIIHNTNAQTYMEVLSDGSAMVFQGVSSMPTITSGDVRQITITIIPSFVKFVKNIFSLTTDDISKLNSLGLKDEKGENLVFTSSGIPINNSSIPTTRVDYHTDKSK